MTIDLAKIKAHHASIVKNGEVCIKAATITTPSVDRSTRLIKGLVSVASSDLDNEVVVPSGLDKWYFPKSVQSVYLNHDYGFPIGTCVNLALRKGGTEMYATTYILPTAIGEDILTAVEHGAMSGFSIGFMPEDRGAPTKEEMGIYGKSETITRAGTLLEYSITAMPTNPGALIDLAQKSLIHRSSAIAFGLADGSNLDAVLTEKPRRTFVVLGGHTWSKA